MARIITNERMRIISIHWAEIIEYHQLNHQLSLKYPEWWDRGLVFTIIWMIYRRIIQGNSLFTQKNQYQIIDNSTWKIKKTYFNYFWIFYRILDSQNHSRCNENVTFGKRDYNDFNFMYLNGLDRSEAETTTELWKKQN